MKFQASSKPADYTGEVPSLLLAVGDTKREDDRERDVDGDEELRHYGTMFSFSHPPPLVVGQL